MGWLAAERSPCDPNLLAAASVRPPARMIVAGADEPTVMESVKAGVEHGLLEPILIGSSSRMLALAETEGLDLSSTEVINAEGEAAIAAALTSRAALHDISGIMKGHVHTDVFMAALLNKAAKLRTDRRFTHHFRMNLSGARTPIFISDAALNILPDVATKKVILEHTVQLAKISGIERPRIAILSATESVSPHMPSSGEAAELAEWAATALPDADVQGPLAFDNAVSTASAQLKGISGPVAGQADGLIVPSIEVGNALFKAMVYLLGACPAGIVMGARVPIVLTSRADDAEARLASMALSRIASS